jgi:hypothetical protein
MRARTDPDNPEGDRPALFVAVDENLARELSDVRVAIELHREQLERLSALVREFEGDDKLSNFAIQQLMSDYNAAETLASSVQKKLNDTIACIIGKL